MRLGYEVTSLEGRGYRGFDFIASTETEKIAIEVKTFKSRHFLPLMRTILDRQINYLQQALKSEEVSKVHIVCVLRDDEDRYPLSRLYQQALKLLEEAGEKIEIYFGKLNEENGYSPLEI